MACLILTASMRRALGQSAQLNETRALRLLAWFANSASTLRSPPIHVLRLCGQIDNARTITQSSTARRTSSSRSRVAARGPSLRFCQVQARRGIASLVGTVRRPCCVLLEADDVFPGAEKEAIKEP